jgi:hypothetical protein
MSTLNDRSHAGNFCFKDGEGTVWQISRGGRLGFTDGRQCTTLVTGMVVARYFVVLIRAGPG